MITMTNLNTVQVRERLFSLVTKSAGWSSKRHELIEKLQDQLDKAKENIPKIKHPETGNTILHEAVFQNNICAVRMILSLKLKDIDEYFIVQNPKNNEDFSALDIAEKNGIPEIITLLKAHIAQDRAMQFVIRLVERYKKKIERCKKIFSGEPVAYNQNSTGQMATTAIGVGVRVVGIGCATPVVTFVTDNVRRWFRLERAEHLWHAHHRFYTHHFGGELPEGLAKLLVPDGFEIFACLEEYLVNKVSLKAWKKKLDSLAEECVERMMNFLQAEYQEDEAKVFEEGHFTEAFMRGWANGIRSGQWKKVLDNAGIIMRDPNDDNAAVTVRHFISSNETSDTGKYGYRKLFRFEMQEEFPENYSETMQASNSYGTFLTDRMIAKCVTKLLVKMKIASETEEEDCDNEEYENMMVEVMPVCKSAIHYDVEKHVDPFIGREYELERLRAWFTNTQSLVDINADNSAGMIVTGSCGVGKTELVRKFANELYDKQNIHIVFLDGKNLDQSFRQFYEYILTPHCSTTEGSRDSVDGGNLMAIYPVVRFCYRYLNQRERTLVVLLNVESVENVKNYLPNSKKYDNIRLLITSKSPSEEWGNLTMGYKQEVLKAFSDDDCEDMLRSVGSHRDLDIIRLANVLDYSPLALAQIKEYIFDIQKSQPDVPRGQIAAEVVNSFIDSFYGNKGEYTPIVQAIFEKEVHGKNILKTWAEVLERIGEREDGPVAILICEFMAYLAPIPVFLQTFMEGQVADKTRLFNAIKLLEKYGILKEEESNGLWQMRFMVKKFIRYQNGKSRNEAEELDSLLEHMLNILSSNNRHHLSGDFIKHIVFAWSYAVHHDKLIEKYILNFPGYSHPSNSFFHVVLKHDPYKLLEILLDKLRKIEEGKVQKSVIANSKMLADGATLLHISVAISDSHVRTTATKMIMSWGATVTAKDYQGNTPLHVAAQMGHTDVVEMLLGGVDRKSMAGWRNKNGETAYFLAIWRKHVETARIIRENVDRHVAGNHLDENATRRI